jgi:hypothetical protein
VAKSLPSDVSETVRNGRIPPLGGNESCFPREAIECLLRDPRLEPMIHDQNHGDYENADDSESVEEKPVSEPHAVLGWPPRSL